MTANSDSNKDVYDFRFPTETDKMRHLLWGVLVKGFFQDLIPASSVLVDFGCGRGEFLGQIIAKRKIGIDRENLLLDRYAGQVEFMASESSNWDFLQEDSVDVIFASNVFEHFESKKELDQVLLEMRRVLRQKGRLIILTPNIRLEPRRYWDYYDHHLALSERSIAEALVKAGFKVERTISRFLPWSSESKVPFGTALLWTYLRIPIFWKLLGKQSLIIGAK
jgi:SAM-dependent methyltransferase